MSINTSGLDKIHQRYNPEHDLGAEAPIHWSVEELALLVGRLVEVVEEQRRQIEALQDDVSGHKFFGGL